MNLGQASLGSSSPISLGGYIPAPAYRPSVSREALLAFMQGAAGQAGNRLAGAVLPTTEDEKIKLAELANQQQYQQGMLSNDKTRTAQQGDYQTGMLANDQTRTQNEGQHLTAQDKADEARLSEASRADLAREAIEGKNLEETKNYHSGQILNDQARNLNESVKSQNDYLLGKGNLDMKQKELDEMGPVYGSTVAKNTAETEGANIQNTRMKMIGHDMGVQAALKNAANPVERATIMKADASGVDVTNANALKAFIAGDNKAALGKTSGPVIGPWGGASGSWDAAPSSTGTGMGAKVPVSTPEQPTSTSDAMDGATPISGGIGAPSPSVLAQQGMPAAQDPIAALRAFLQPSGDFGANTAAAQAAMKALQAQGFNPQNQ